MSDQPQIQDIDLTPYNGGMVLDAPSTRIPDLACLVAKNYIMRPAGPYRRPGDDYYISSTVDYPPVRDLITYWKLDGTQETLLLDSKFLYAAAGGTLTGKYWTYSTGTISTSGATVTGSGTAWDTASNYIRPGDVMVLDADGSGDGPEAIEITAVASATSITLASTPSGTYGASTDYEIRRAFAPGDDLVDFAIVPDPETTSKQVVFADGTHPIMSYDGSSFGLHGTGNDFIAKCVGWVAPGQNRLFAGYTIESSTHWRQRLRWTRPLDPIEFNTGSPDTYNDFLDLPQTGGYIRRLLALGHLLVAYFDNAVAIGRPTNRADLPYAFDFIDTGGMGLVGTKAVCSWIDAHYFVMSDDIYRLRVNGSLEPIGSPVVKDTIDACNFLNHVWVAPDPDRDRIVFGFPRTNEDIARIWSYCYKTNAWSYDDVTATMLANREYVDSDTWASYGGTWGSATTTWGDYSSKATGLFYGYQSRVARYEPDRTLAADDVPISAELVSKDYDLGLPDRKKTGLRISIKIDRTLTSNLRFQIFTSTDRGLNYEQHEDLVIPAGDDENFTNFIVSGSTIRFKVVSTSAVTSYYIENIVVRIKGRGLEAQLGPQD